MGKLESVERDLQEAFRIQMEKRQRLNERSKRANRMFTGMLLLLVIIIAVAGLWCLADYLVYGTLQNSVTDTVVCILLSCLLWFNIRLNWKQK